MNLFKKRIHGVLFILLVCCVAFLSGNLAQATAAGQRLGGMDLGGYCQSIGQGGSALNGSTWVCTTTNSAINMNSACQWQYPGQNAVASQDIPGNPYTWTCYAGSAPVTPTPTPTTSLIPTATPTPTQSLQPTATPIVLPTATLTPKATPTPTPTTTPGTSHYLALGDSFAFGFHLAKYNQEIASHTYSASSFNDGYGADFFNYLKGVLSGITEVNYSCPGETSGSFVNGGCAFHSSTSALHSSYPTNQPQLQAAVTYLQQNPSTVVTIDIGVNDAINLSDTCQAQTNPVNCYNQRTSGVLSSEKQNFDTILNALQKAAPGARVVLIKAPDPVFYNGSDNLVNGINQIVDNEASSRGLREADTYSIFTANNVCSLTNFCSSPSDFHPNAAGYSSMANVIRSVSGY